MPNGYWFEYNEIKSTEIASNSGDASLNDDDFKLIVRRAIMLPSPARKINVYKVPGRNGDIVQPQNAWENIRIDIDVFVYCAEHSTTELFRFCRAISEWLHGGINPGGYNDLIIGGTEGYYEAYFQGPYNVENILYQFGKATLTFNAKPTHFAAFDAYRYYQSTSPNYDGVHEMKWDSTNSVWYVDVANNTLHDARPRISIRQPASISGYGSSQIYGLKFRIETLDGAYYQNYVFNGRPFPVDSEGTHTNFRNFVIDSEMQDFLATPAVYDTTRTGRHIRTYGVDASRYVEMTGRKGSPESSNFPWLIAGKTSRISVRYAKFGDTITYFNDAPETIAVETRGWTL